MFRLEFGLGVACGSFFPPFCLDYKIFRLIVGDLVSRSALSLCSLALAFSQPILTGSVVHFAGAFNCSLGFWVPKNSSLLPTYDRCKADIFGQMIEGCQGDATVNVASANLKRLPRRTETERDTGEAFDPLYPSELFVLLL